MAALENLSSYEINSRIALLMGWKFNDNYTWTPSPEDQLTTGALVSTTSVRKYDSDINVILDAIDRKPKLRLSSSKTKAGKYVVCLKKDGLGFTVENKSFARAACFALLWAYKA